MTPPEGASSMPIDINDLMNHQKVQHMAHQVDPNDPSILGNEFEVPQEQTLNTEDF